MIFPPTVRILLGVAALFLFIQGAHLRGSFSPEKRKSLIQSVIRYFIPAGCFFLILAVMAIQARHKIPSLNFLTSVLDPVFSLGGSIQSRLAAAGPVLKLALPGGAVFLSLLALAVKKKAAGKLVLILLAIGAILPGQLLIYGQIGALTGWLLTGTGIVLMFAYARGSDSPPDFTSPSPRSERIIFGFILLVGFILRFYHLDIYPYEFLNYEASDGLAALQLLKKEPEMIKTLWNFFDRPIMDSYTCPFTAYPIAFLFSLFGSSIALLRAVSAFYGLLTVAMLYVFGRRLYSGYVGLIAAWLVAVSPWHLAASRVGLFLNLASLYSLVLFFFFYQAIRSGKVRYYLLTALVICVYWLFYLIVKVLLLLILVLFIYCLVTKRGFIRKNWLGLICFALALLFFIQLFGDNPRHWFLSLGRQSENTIWRLRSNLMGGYLGPETRAELLSAPRQVAAFKLLVNNLRHLFRDLYLQSRHEFLINDKGPLVNTFLLIFWPLGLVFSLRRWKEKRYFLLAAWFAIGLIPQLLFMPSVGRAAPRHLLVFLPPLYLLIALPIGRIFFELRLFRSPLTRGSLKSLAILLGLGLATINITTYFQGPKYTYEIWSDRRDSARYLNQLLDEYYLYIIQFRGPIFLTTRPIDFLTYPKVKYLHYFLGETNPRIRAGEAEADHKYSYLTTTQSRVNKLPPPAKFVSRPGVFVFEEENHQKRLEEKYPGGRSEVYRNDEGKLLFYLYYPRGQ